MNLWFFYLSFSIAGIIGRCLQHLNVLKVVFFFLIQKECLIPLKMNISIECDILPWGHLKHIFQLYRWLCHKLPSCLKQLGSCNSYVCYVCPMFDKTDMWNMVYNGDIYRMWSVIKMSAVLECRTNLLVKLVSRDQSIYLLIDFFFCLIIGKSFMFSE